MSAAGPRTALVALLALAAAAAGIAYALRGGLVGLEPLEPPAVPKGLAPPVAAAIERARAPVAADPGDAGAWGALGGAFHVHGLLEQAIPCYRRAQALDPDRFLWPYLLGRCLESASRREAMEQFLLAAARRDDYAPLYERIGRGWFALDDLDAARAAFEQAISIDPGLVRAWVGLGNVALAAGDDDAALRHLRAAVDHGARESEVQTLLAEALRRAGDLEGARRHLRLAEDGKPFEELPDPVYARLQREAGATIDAYRMRADAQLARGSIEGALAEWRQAAVGYPGAAEPLAQIGALEARRGRIEPAIASFRGALELRVDYPVARLELGRLLVMSGRADDGVAEIRRVIAGHPDLADGYVGLARAMQWTGRDEDAVKAVRWGLERLPGDARLTATLEEIRPAPES